MGEENDTLVHNYDVPMVDGIEVRRKVSGYLNRMMLALNELYNRYMDHPTEMQDKALTLAMHDALITITVFEELGMIRKRCSNRLFEEINNYLDSMMERKRADEINGTICND